MRRPTMPEARPESRFDREIAPVHQEGTARQQGCALPTPLISQVIGYSEEDRPIAALHLGHRDAPLRVLILAGQHGDESRARMAAVDVAAAFAERASDAGPVALTIIPDLNPDGAARAQRENACDVDLNRDHALLKSAETRALHRFVREWQPHLVIDMHTYPPRRKHLLEEDLIYCHDVFLDVPTNPSLHHAALASGGRQRFFDNVAGGLEACGYRSARYTLVNDSGRVRHSTPDVIDARNALTLRYGCLTVLVEGRRPVRTDDETAYACLGEALQSAMRQILAWAVQHQSVLTLQPAPLRPSTSVTIDSRYARAEAPRTMAFEDAATGDVRNFTLPGKYTPHLESTRRVRLPSAYAVPQSQKEVLDVLARHGFPGYPGRSGCLRQVEHTRVLRVRQSTRDRRAPRRLSVAESRTRRALPDYRLFPVTEKTGRALAVLLEAKSKYGLHRFREAHLTLEERSVYPVLRVF